MTRQKTWALVSNGVHARILRGLESGALEDPITRDMQDFAHETLSTLETHLRAGRLTRLAIFAAPKMLGGLAQ